MGFQLASERVETSCQIYTPFWQGALVQNICLVSSSNMLILQLEQQKKSNVAHDWFYVTDGKDVNEATHSHQNMFRVNYRRK